MEFGILGTVQVVVDGRSVPLGRRLTRKLLAYLLLHANEPVSSDQLIDRIWGPDPPPAALASMQNYMSRLRGLLESDLIQNEPAGYVLRVDPERLDLARFERLVAEARAAPAPERARLLRAALALWRGPPLDDLGFEEFLQSDIGRLNEQRLKAIEDRITADLELGCGGELVEELETLIADHPVRERLRGQLMIALYRDDRQADALAVYTDARHALRERLGLEPSEWLRDIQRRILEHDPELLAAAGAQHPAPPLVASRRTVTVLFCDLVDSTRLATTLDPEAYQRLISTYYDAVRGAIEAHGGTVEKLIGDAVMAVFGVPELHEDDALRAVRAALDARATLARLDEEATRTWDVRLRARIAVNSGEVVVAVPGSDAIVTGAAVNVAAQLTRRAGPGEILLGGEAMRLTRDAVRADPVDLEDGTQAWRLEEAVANAPIVARHFDARLVGREDELRRLTATFRATQAEQRCAVVTLAGEAGIGKTRLARELLDSIADEARVLIGRCVAYGSGATYLPVAEIVEQVAPGASTRAIAALLDRDDDAEQVAQRVAELVGGAEGQAAPGEAFWAIRRLLEALARKQPLLVVLDDLQWAEPTLLDLVEYLGGWATGPMLILCTARPDLLESRPDWGSPSSTGFVIDLPPLRATDVSALVDELSPKTVAPDLQLRIVERAGGNPLFAEQLLAVATEAPDASLDRAPPTLEALIASRLERLRPRELDLLRRVSVLGRRFSRAVMNDLGPVDDGDLLALVRRGLLHPSEPRVEGWLRFHHVLVRDVAYRGIPKAVRSELHERAADGLDRHGGPDELVGYHLEQAVRYRSEIARIDEEAQRLATRAGEHLGAAGLRAWRRGDVGATVNLLTRATDLIASDHPLRSELLCTLATGTWLAGSAAAGEIYHAAVGAAVDTRSELYARMEQAYFRLFTKPDADPDELLVLAAEAIEFFEELGDHMYAARAWLHQAVVHGALLCRHESSLAAAEHATDHVRRADEQPASSLIAVSAALFSGPTPAREAIQRCDALLEGATGGGEAGVLVFSAGLLAMLGDFDVARARVTRAAELFTELGWTTHASTDIAPVLAEIELLAGDAAAAERVLEESCRSLERGPGRTRAPLATQASQLADLLGKRGDLAEAERWLVVAERCAARNDVNAQLWHGIAGSGIAARRGDRGRAELLARTAFDLGRETDALNDRAATALALANVALDRPKATHWIEQALALYEQKENLAAAANARALLHELPVA